MQSFNTSLIESTDFEGNDFPAGDPSLEVGYEVLSDLGMSDERTHCFFEGRGLLLGV